VAGFEVTTSGRFLGDHRGWGADNFRNSGKRAKADYR